MNNFEIFNETEERIAELKDLKGLLDYALDYLKLDNVEFNIIIIDNPRIHEINKEYRGVDRETDVITFALEDHKDIEFEKGHQTLREYFNEKNKKTESGE